MTARSLSSWVPQRAEVIFIQYNPQVGKEMPDEHPMLVISAQAFASRTSLVVGFPLTHSEQNADNPFAVLAPSTKGKPGYVLVHQPKSFDWRQRGARPHPLGTGHDKLLATALELFDTIFNVCDHERKKP